MFIIIIIQFYFNYFYKMWKNEPEQELLTVNTQEWESSINKEWKYKQHVLEILNTNLNEEILKMYELRTKRHIERVQIFYWKLVEWGLIPQDDIHDVTYHDEDKLQPGNMKRQALRYTNDGHPDEECMKIINDVIREHIKTSPHHCEYRWNPEDDHLTMWIHCESMPDEYIYEMMADWASTAEERGTLIIDWYKKCVDGGRDYYNAHQKELMLKCIEFLQKQIDPNRKSATVIGTDPASKMLK